MLLLLQHCQCFCCSCCHHCFSGHKEFEHRSDIQRSALSKMQACTKMSCMPEQRIPVSDVWTQDRKIKWSDIRNGFGFLWLFPNMGTIMKMKFTWKTWRPLNKAPPLMLSISFCLFLSTVLFVHPLAGWIVGALSVSLFACPHCRLKLSLWFALLQTITWYMVSLFYICSIAFIVVWIRVRKLTESGDRREKKDSISSSSSSIRAYLVAWCGIAYRRYQMPHLVKVSLFMHLCLVCNLYAWNVYWQYSLLTYHQPTNRWTKLTAEPNTTNWSNHHHPLTLRRLFFSLSFSLILFCSHK